MKRILKTIFFTIYILIILFVTIYLFSLNRFGVSEFGKITLFSSENLDEFQNGNLLLVKKKALETNIGDKIIYYDTYLYPVSIKVSSVKEKKEINSTETTFKLSDDQVLSSSNLIGREKDVVKIPLIGYVLEILSSTFGYLLFIILPVLFFLIYRIVELRKELRGEQCIKSL